MAKSFILDELEVYSELWRAAHPGLAPDAFGTERELLDHCKSQARDMGVTIQDYLANHVNFVFEDDEE